MSVALDAVLAELRSHVGFREGPNNENPFGPEQGVRNAAYCDSFASMCPYHVGYRWWPEGRFGDKGEAYTVYHVQIGERHGEVRYDHSGKGDPADVLAGDLLFYAWTPKTTPDHVETAIEDAAPGNSRTHNIGANTGSPGGVYDLWRDRKYLLCRLRPSRDGGYTRGANPNLGDDDFMANASREEVVEMLTAARAVNHRLPVEGSDPVDVEWAVRYAMANAIQANRKADAIIAALKASDGIANPEGKFPTTDELLDAMGARLKTEGK